MSCWCVLALLAVAVLSTAPAAAMHSGEVSPAAPSVRRAGSSRRTTLSPRVLYLERCEDKKHSLHIYNYSALMERHGLVLFNALLDVQTEARSLSMMKVILHRCRDAVSSNTCEYFATWPFQMGICTMITAKGMMWSGFMRAFHPTFECPVKATTYRLENGTVDVSLGETIANINIADNVWKVEVQTHNQDKQLYTCLKTAVHITRVTIKD